MLDSDLAELYGVAPKRLNEQVQRNIDRFPSRYMFQLNFNEWVSLRSQFATLKNSRGQHKKYLPYVFSEQGVAMLSGILKSEMAIKISISIIDAFVLLRKSNIQNHVLRKIITLENKQLETDKKIDYIFDALEKADTTPTQGIFFNGQIFDAYTFASKIIKSAKESIILIDNYIDESTLAILSKRAKNVEAIIYTNNRNQILPIDLDKYNQQYPPIAVHILKNTHDRFLIIDKKEMYHIGASLKDLGKKLFAFSRMDKETKTILNVLKG
jgi:hypothetical protein